MVRDRKRLAMSGSSAVVPFCIAVVGLPLWLVTILPCTVLYQLCLIPFKKKPRKVDFSADQRLPAPTSVTPQKTREYDLVLFGATGFTGKMAAKYLARNYAGKCRWAIAGRKKEVLEAIRQELASISDQLNNLPILIADSSNPDSLRAVVNNTRVIVTTVGPFDRYGTPLVELCAQYGTHYCDITGETDWVRKTIHLFDDQARETGARIVHFCGHDCVPWDLAVLSLSNKLRASGENLVGVEIYDEMRGTASGGTLETLFHSLEHRVRASFPYDPLLKTPQGKSEAKTITANQSFLGYSGRVKKWVGPFVMAMVMANCVRRSNAVNRYGKVVYREAAVYPSFMAGFATIFGYLVFASALFFPPLKWVLRKFVLPPPGQGPSEADMDKGFLKITGFGKGDKGGEACVSMYFPTDPGYRDTARMLVESGLSFVFHEDKIAAQCPGGVWTPATCQGTVLLERLVETGSTFEIQ